LIFHSTVLLSFLISLLILLLTYLFLSVLLLKSSLAYVMSYIQL
jgi:hypothetical protein